MASPNQVRVKFDTLRTLAHGSISGTYAAVGTATTAPARIIKIYNSTDVDITISFDGSTDQDIIRTATSQEYDFCSNASFQGGYFELASNTTIYAKGSPGSGSVFVTIIYATGG